VPKCQAWAAHLWASEKVLAAKVMILDPKAALAILDLEMLCCFNNWHHELQVKAQKQCEKKSPMPPKTVCQLKAKTAHIKPSMQAAKDITQDCNKGPYLSHRLRKMAHVSWKLVNSQRTIKAWGKITWHCLTDLMWFKGWSLLWLVLSKLRREGLWSCKYIYLLFTFTILIHIADEAN